MCKSVVGCGDDCCVLIAASFTTIVTFLVSFSHSSVKVEVSQIFRGFF